MTRLACLSSLALVLATSCGGNTKAATTPENTPPADQPVAQSDGPLEGLTDGALWSCQIEDYDPQPCKFHKESDGWHLSKLLGSQRFTALATIQGLQIDLEGEFFCPWGDCTAPVKSSLVPSGDGGPDRFSGDVAGSPTTVWWDESLANEWGGAGYGGLTGREVD